MRSRAILHTALIWLTVLAVLGLWTCLANADIQVKPAYDVHEPIVATVSVPGMPDGAVLRKAKFKCPGASIVQVDEAAFHIWAAPGTYTVEATGTWRLYQTIIDKQDKEWKVIADEDDYEFSATFTVGKGPDPDPPDPPTPGGPWQIVLFYDQDQLDNLQSEQRALLTSLVYRQQLTAAKHLVLGVFALQSVGNLDSKFAPYLDAVAGDSMPRIAWASLKGGKVSDAPLPANFADLEKLLATGVKP